MSEPNTSPSTSSSSSSSSTHPSVPSPTPSEGEIHVTNPDEATVESNVVFEDQLGQRQKSPRRVLEETFDDEISRIGQGLPLPEEPVPGVSIRFRAPPASAPTHDVFGDALHVYFQKLMSREQPAELCHWIAYVLAKEADKFSQPAPWEPVQFDPSVYVTEGTLQAKKAFADGMWPAADRILTKNAQIEECLNDKWTGIGVSADQLRGQRNKQEDRFVAYPNGMYMNRGEDPIALLAVFDGHGGSECSQYAAAHMWEEWLRARRMLDGYLEQSLTSSLASLDERMTVRSEKESWKGGSTAVCCAVDMDAKEMAFAWLGDSPGYVMNNLEFRKVTRDHSPTDPEEARRVEECGGQLFMIGGELRVNGVLNLTRALGDIQGRPMISNVAESCQVAIEPNDYLVLLACDGISDVFGPRELYSLVEAFCNDRPVEDYEELSYYICDQAVNEGSNDNVTVVIGFLRPPQDVWNLMKQDSDDEEEETGE